MYVTIVEGGQQGDGDDVSGVPALTWQLGVGDDNCRTFVHCEA